MKNDEYKVNNILIWSTTFVELVGDVMTIGDPNN